MGQSVFTDSLALDGCAGSTGVMQDALKSRWALLLKRSIDITMGSIGLMLALPLMLGIAIAIKSNSHGPVLYRSPRVGRNGLVFICYKFRTMCAEADQRKEELRSRNEREGAFFKLHNDPRITPLGGWLRRYSLDELPQFWNVLRGDMSLVGPRPHPVDDVARYEVRDLGRLNCSPGITGLWQVTARRDPSFRRCVSLDLDYIRNWSLLLDIQILAKTLPVVLRGSGE